MSHLTFITEKGIETIELDRGLEILCLRKIAKLTQSEFAKLMGIPTKTLAMWETGYHKVPDGIVDEMYRKLRSLDHCRHD
jgi:DNA-binding transcriptional regulator YiaG